MMDWLLDIYHSRTVGQLVVYGLVIVVVVIVKLASSDMVRE